MYSKYTTKKSTLYNCACDNCLFWTQVGGKRHFLFEEKTKIGLKIKKEAVPNGTTSALTK